MKISHLGNVGLPSASMFLFTKIFFFLNSFKEIDNSWENTRPLSTREILSVCGGKQDDIIHQLWF